MIRLAEISDFDQILDLAQDFWLHTQFSEPFERAHTLDMVSMSYDHGLLAVLEVDGKVEGFAAGISSPLLGSTYAKAGTELAWWVNPHHRSGGRGVKLLRFMEGLAKDQGIKYWNMASMQTSMPEKINAMYVKMGYTHSETVYTKVI
jgi:GNAT superfamily N-acetyltransferase